MSLVATIAFFGITAPATPSYAATTTSTSPALATQLGNSVHLVNPYASLGPEVEPPSSIKAEFGATKEEINQRFAHVIETNFSSVGAERVLDHLSNKELADLAIAYQARAGTGSSPLLAIMASRLSDQALLRVASAFGRNAVRQAVIANAAPAVKASFLAKESLVMPLALRPSSLPLPVPPPSSTDWTNTLREIYLDYRTSPELDLTTGEALSATTIYGVSAVGVAASAGWEFGTGVSTLITDYDPSLNDAIGGTVANMISAGLQSGTELEQGQYESAFDSLFGLPITDSTNPSGPDGLTDPMVYYYQTYGAPPGYDGGGCASEGLCVLNPE